MSKINILSLTADGLSEGLVTDTLPRFAYSYDGDMTSARLEINGQSWDAANQTAVSCEGLTLRPRTDYTAKLTVTSGEDSDTRTLTFRTGRLDTPWQAKWITDGAYTFTEKKVSPKVLSFRRSIVCKKAVKRAELYATALGMYELTLDGAKVGDRYLAPGFTSYRHDLMYQTYDVTAQLQPGDHELLCEVAGGWAVGSFVFTRANRITADRQALLLELHIEYMDGGSEVIGTDTGWQTASDGPVKMADLYDGETYDATVEPAAMGWHAASEETLKLKPVISADSGERVTRHEVLTPKYMKSVNGRDIYDCGQNFAGVVSLRIKGRKGQTVTIRHAEILKADGDLNTAFLRSAKATFTYTCRDGWQEYAPRFSYMGFRYLSVEGMAGAEMELKAYALYSDVQPIGSFSCSNDLLNRLNENIQWGARSNFVDIPTDCPQRDERMGWTGDICVFARTACYNFGMNRFLRRWLRDMRSEQLPTGGIPNTIPAQSYAFPTTMPYMAVDFWGDACVMVPWAMYLATGDVQVLRENYTMMKKYVKACRFWAGLGVGEQRYIWHTPATLHFGDWVAADVPKMSQWQGRSRWTATASIANTSGLLSQIAALLGENEDAKKYAEISQKTGAAYQHLLMQSDGSLKEEFQTGYVLPLYFHMLDEEHTKAAAQHLAELVRRNGYRIGTGFPGTPYILFALADNGYADDAVKMLMNTDCPSWLYEVRVGATTIWERWDGLDENGLCPIGDDGTGGMISYNHYASGAVGDFLYRRVLGLEPTEAGYRRFTVKPLGNTGLDWCKGETMTPYGRIAVEWKQEGAAFTLKVTVPSGTECTAILPDGTEKKLTRGEYTLQQ